MDPEWTRAHFYLGENKWAVPEFFRMMVDSSREDQFDDETMDCFKTQSNKVILIPDELDFSIDKWGGIKYASSDLQTVFQITADRRGYGRFKFEGSSFAIHLFVGFMHFGARPTSTHSIDHADRNAANNSPLNLSWATDSDQVRNRTKGDYRRRQVEFEFIDSDEYVLVRFVPHLNAIYDFEPHGNMDTVHLAIDGTHFVLNRSDRYDTPSDRGLKACHRISMRLNDHRIGVKLHHLLYLNFHDHLPELMFVDNNDNNWSLSNLRPANRSERSLANRYEKRLFDSAATRNKRVRLISTSNDSVYEFDSVTAAARFICEPVPVTKKQLKNTMSKIARVVRKGAKSSSRYSAYGFNVEYIV